MIKNPIKKPIKHGVPQGSILGPLLYIIYMNDFVHSSKIFKKVLFADDTNLFLSHYNPIVLQSIANEEIEKVNLWLICNKLSLNIKKTNYIIFRSNKNRKLIENICLTIDGQVINRVQSTKFLGIHIDEHLNFRYHIDQLTSRLSKYSGLFFRLRDYLPLSALLILYRSLFEPHLLYCNIIWCNTFPSYLLRLQLLQKKVIRTIFWAHFRDHTGPLFESAGLLNLTDLNVLLNVCTVYQVVNQSNACLCELVPICNPQHRHNTRNKHWIWGKKRKRTITNFSVTCRGFQLWNSLDNEVKNSKSLYLFKKVLKKKLLLKYVC